MKRPQHSVSVWGLLTAIPGDQEMGPAQRKDQRAAEFTAVSFTSFTLSLCLFLSIYLPVSFSLLPQTSRLVKSLSTLWKKIAQCQPQECATLSRRPSAALSQDPRWRISGGPRALRGCFLDALSAPSAISLSTKQSLGPRSTPSFRGQGLWQHLPSSSSLDFCKCGPGNY